MPETFGTISAHGRTWPLYQREAYSVGIHGLFDVGAAEFARVKRDIQSVLAPYDVTVRSESRRMGTWGSIRDADIAQVRARLEHVLSPYDVKVKISPETETFMSPEDEAEFLVLDKAAAGGEVAVTVTEGE